MHDKESRRQQLYRLLQVELEKINQNNKVDINESILTPLQDLQNRLRILEQKLNKTDNSQQLIVECKGFNKNYWSKYYYVHPYYFQQRQMDKYGQQNTNEYDGLDRKYRNKYQSLIIQDEQNTNQTYSNQTDNKDNNQSDNSQVNKNNKQNPIHLIQSNKNSHNNQSHKQSLYQQNNPNIDNHKHTHQSQQHKNKNKSINTIINYHNYNHIKQHPNNNTLTTTTKRKAKSSSNINSNKITPQNSQLNTPHKLNNIIIHSHSNTLKIHSNTNYTNHTKILTLNQINNHKLNSHQKHSHNRSHNKFSSSNKKSKSQTSQIQDKFNTDNKLTPKYLSNKKNNQINSQTKLRVKSTHNNIKKYQNNKYPFSITNEQDDPKKLLLKLSTNLRLSNKKNNMIYNVLDYHVLRYSREPLIPLKEKIHLQRQLKQYEKQNKKLKAQIGHLKKYQQEYSKIKQLFQNSHQNQIKINKSHINFK